MDGTMVDTHTVWATVNKTLSANHGVVFEDAVRRKMMGKKDIESLAIFKEFYGLTTPVETLVQERRAILLSNTSTINTNPGLRELLDLLDHLSIKKAVATSSFREFTHTVLLNTGLTNRFDVIVTGDDIQTSKPNPEIFITAAELLNVPSAQCLVIEDAQNGIEAAYNAGMRSIAIPHEDSKTHDMSKATRVIDSMHRIDAVFLRGL